MSRAAFLAITGLALSTGAQNAVAPIIVQANKAQQVQAELTYDEQGHLQTCTILKSSGDPELDKKGCDLIRKCVPTHADLDRHPRCAAALDSKPSEH